MHVSDGAQDWFVKTNERTGLDMFEAEAEGLGALAAADAIRVPRVLCTGLAENTSYIVMQYLKLGPAGSGGQRLAGRQLAALHARQADLFGWERDNTIGSTPQINTRNADWIGFWREHRLGYQLQLAAARGHGGRLQAAGHKLLERFPALIDHAPRPALLHGDLWSGNLGFDAAGRPVIFDPAVYYGDPEADLAMTELFGGFSGDFYAAYAEAAPVDPGYRVRKTLYNLYHVLNHLNLFGSGYAGQAQDMIDRLLAEC